MFSLFGDSVKRHVHTLEETSRGWGGGQFSEAGKPSGDVELEVAIACTCNCESPQKVTGVRPEAIRGLLGNLRARSG